MAWISVLPLLLVAALVLFEERVTIPDCKIVTADGLDLDVASHDSNDLRVMLVADLLLMGSDASFTNAFFRDSYTTKFFRKSYEWLRPDMLVVLGDLSAKGSEMKHSEWSSVLQQFQTMLGPFLGLPLHVVLGDRDIGGCNNLNAKSVDHIATSFPGLNSAGCGAFEISNFTFISLNNVALLCGNNDLRFSVEKFIENESLNLRNCAKSSNSGLNKPEETDGNSFNFNWRENPVCSGSGPILLLHFPLHQKTGSNSDGTDTPRRNFASFHHSGSRLFDNSGFSGAGSYEYSFTLPPNATEYILQALRPRIIFSAHTHQFFYHIHADGIHEVAVPAMTWDARNDPGFIIAIFRQNNAVMVSHCALAKESEVLVVYAIFFVMLISITLMSYKTRLTP